MESAATSLGWQHRGMQERPTKRASKKFKGGAAKNRQTASEDWRYLKTDTLLMP